MPAQDENRRDPYPSYALDTFISVDLGETTGIATYRRWTNTVRLSWIEDPNDVIPTITLIGPGTIILERFPDNRSLPADVERVYGILSETAILIAPAAWKPFMKNRRTVFVSGSAENQHEADALNMLRYYLITYLEKDIE